MLINCPRCGKSQPQDQYCAQCGVDMLNYKPKEKPMLNQIIGSTIFQVGVLVVIAFFVGQTLLRNSAPQLFVKSIMRSQGVTRSQSSKNGTNDEVENEVNLNSRPSSGSANAVSPNAANGAFGNSQNPNASGVAAAGSVSGTAAGTKGVGEFTVPNMRLTYAEVPIDVLNKWIVDSSNAGLYQSLPDYAVGILSDFHKRNEKFQVLKSSDLRILAGSSNTNLSGIMSDDGSQLIGLTANIELKSSENDTLVGSVSVTKSGRPGNENFPSEFELPKASAFFIIGTLKVDNFQQERAKLQMPPFQVFKSQDFMTRKTEFVIILEPVYK